jgi:hypothetical protein
LINSVNGKEQSLASALPLAREHGAAVIGLTLDSGIEGYGDAPGNRTKIVERPAQELCERMRIIDCLCRWWGRTPIGKVIRGDTTGKSKRQPGLPATLRIAQPPDHQPELWRPSPRG